MPISEELGLSCYSFSKGHMPIHRYRLIISILFTLLLVPACMPGRSVPRPSGWETPSYWLSCPDISGAYHYLGDLATEHGISSHLNPPFAFFSQRNRGVFTAHVMTHWRITPISPGQWQIDAMTRDRPIARERATSSCHWGTLTLSIGKSQFDIAVTNDKALVVHWTVTDCVFFFCKNREHWTRWSLLAASGVPIIEETDARDFIASGCQRGNIDGCRSYLQRYPMGEFRERANYFSATTLPVHIGAPLAIGATKQDCNVCPTMVYVPAGNFLMGYPGDPEQMVQTPHSHEVPQHEVHVEAFWMGQTSVTVKEWHVCVKDGDCSPVAEAFTDPQVPVTSVNSERAEQYLRWLKKKTGKDYRLPSEAEWEYAARAGTTSVFYWGDKYLSGHVDHVEESQANYSVPAPVGRYPPNPWGLKDMGGNAFNLTSDCWHDNFDYAPNMALPWKNDNFGDCRKAVIRGSWRTMHFSGARSTYRFGSDMTRPLTIAFRVATSSL